LAPPCSVWRACGEWCGRLCCCYTTREGNPVPLNTYNLCWLLLNIGSDFFDENCQIWNIKNPIFYLNIYIYFLHLLVDSQLLQKKPVVLLGKNPALKFLGCHLDLPGSKSGTETTTLH
jgi:hypothetical protein